MAPPRTLFDKIWENHVIAPQSEGTYLIYIDLHLIHEVTTPQAFEGLKLAGRKVRRPDATMAVADHNVPTSDRSRGIDDPESLHANIKSIIGVVESGLFLGMTERAIIGDAVRGIQVFSKPS